MNALRGILTDLRDRRLWPLAVALLIGIVAVPVLLTRGAENAPTPAPAVAGLQASLPAGPTVSVGSLPDRSRLRGHERDPFAQHAASTGAAGIAVASGTGATPTVSGSTGASASTGLSGSTASGATSAGTATTSGGSAAGTTTTTSSTTTSSSTTTTTTTTTTSTPTPTPEGLTSKQSYSVALAVNNRSGGFDTIDPLTRLSLVPGDSQPLLIELGVLKGGHRVLFVVQPGTVVAGPGTCTPGPIDCEVLSLADNQTESVSRQTSNGLVPVTTFAVTSISVDDHPSVAEANKARNEVSAAGRLALSRSLVGAVSLFKYDPSAGTVVDLRNLTVGGN